MNTEEQIKEIATAISVLEKQMLERFDSLVDTLKLTCVGEDALFDYIYNSFESGRYKNFVDYYTNLGYTHEHIYDEQSENNS